MVISDNVTIGCKNNAGTRSASLGSLFGLLLAGSLSTTKEIAKEIFKRVEILYLLIASHGAGHFDVDY